MRATYVLAPDRYHRFGRFVHVVPEDLMAAGPGSKLMHDFFRLVTATTDDHVRADVAALLEQLASDPRARPGPMGCVGYCNGVRFLLRTMAEHPGRFAAGVGLHPSFCVETGDASPHHCVSRVTGHLYIAIGGSDHLASVDHNRPLIDEALEARRPCDRRGLPGADHGFAMPGPSYHEAAAARSFDYSPRALPAHDRITGSRPTLGDANSRPGSRRFLVSPRAGEAWLRASCGCVRARWPGLAI